MYVIVLNNNFEYLNRVGIRRAMVLVHKAKVTVEKWSDRVIRTANEVLRVPLIIRLVKLVRTIYKRKVDWCARNVHIRDNYTCRYCGKGKLTGLNLTIDHVLPASRGGKNTFENTVTACADCNSQKGDKTPAEAGMHFVNPGFRPYQPTVMEMINRQMEAQGIAGPKTAGHDTGR